jgi:hypothetical protein
MEYQGNAWILEYRKLVEEKVCGKGNPSEVLPALTPQKSSSIDPAMKETCVLSPYSFET